MLLFLPSWLQKHCEIIFIDINVQDYCLMSFLTGDWFFFFISAGNTRRNKALTFRAAVFGALLVIHFFYSLFFLLQYFTLFFLLGKWTFKSDCVWMCVDVCVLYVMWCVHVYFFVYKRVLYLRLMCICVVWMYVFKIFWKYFEFGAISIYPFMVWLTFSFLIF